MDWYSQPPTTSSSDWNAQNLAEAKRKLITANHILHHHGIVDAYGHISIRTPGNPSSYLMCGYMAPGIVTSPDDLIEYWVHDSSPVDPNLTKKGYSERFIHGDLYKYFGERSRVNCVVHSHAEALLPYVSCGVPLVPVFHMAGFLGTQVPVFDIAPLYGPGDQQDMLVRDSRLGMALASKFGKQGGEEPVAQKGGEAGQGPNHSVVLMRRHGYTTHGKDIETAVYRAIYTKVNASVQTNAMMLRSGLSSFAPAMEARFDFEPLTDEMCEGCSKMNDGTLDKPWRLWVAEVEKLSLYINRG